MKSVLLTNIPAPYREQVHQIVSEQLDAEYHVVYCASIEKNRQWKFPLGNYAKHFLTSRVLAYKGREIYLGSNIRNILTEINPEVVIVSGFSMPMLQAYTWALLRGKKIISFSDANIDSELRLGWLHKILRRFFYHRSHSFIGASQKTLALFETYGADNKQLFQSHLCANNAIFSGSAKPFSQRSFDVLLCGQMIPGKMFNFSLDVIALMQQKMPDIRVKLLGAGPQKAHILSRLDEMGIDYDYPGFVDQLELPQHYAAAKLFFFPSVRDAWGVVANEACAAGTPVFTCPIVGAANELIVDAENGYVLEPEAKIWADKALQVLGDQPLWQNLSDACLKSIEPYTYQNAAQGIVSAISYSCQQRGKHEA